MKKLLYYGDSVTAPTGFGNVARHVLSRVADQFDITILGINEFHNRWPLFPAKIFPAFMGEKDPAGKTKFVDIAQNGEDYDIWFLQNDIHFWEFLPDLVAVVRKTGKNPYIFIHTVIDSPVNPLDVHNLSVADIIGVPSMYGMKELLKADSDVAYKVKHMPYGVDTAEFFPIDQNEIREKRRTGFGIGDDEFLIVNVNHNAQRKDVPRTMMYFSYLREKHNNVVLYLHMQPNEEYNKGWNLQRVVGTNKGWMRSIGVAKNFDAVRADPIEKLNGIYNCADLVVSTSMGEGFGLPTLEAMAAKTLVMVPDNTSLSELVADGRGIPVKCGTTISEWGILRNDPGFIRPYTNIEDMLQKTEEIMKKYPVDIVEKAYRWATGEMGWDKAIVEFRRALMECPITQTSIEGKVIL